jgi:hypothetical protein
MPIQQVRAMPEAYPRYVKPSKVMVKNTIFKVAKMQNGKVIGQPLLSTNDRRTAIDRLALENSCAKEDENAGRRDRLHGIVYAIVTHQIS